ncbi:class I SAM-dependent methyltransferase [Paenibacillus sp. YSY-4.3]
MSSINHWNADLYDNKLSYVSQYGKGIVSILNPQAGERILDLGCGTGDLADEISKAGAHVTGMDYSEEMIQQAKIKYPNIPFITANAENYRTEEVFDAVFSNAALHWMKNAQDVVETIYSSLRTGGRFVAEFGGKGNVGIITENTIAVLEEFFGIPDARDRNPWYFPSISEYSTLLENQGFRVTYAEHFDRPTPLEDGENGLRHWLASFTGDFFSDLSEGEKQQAYALIMNRTKPLLYDGQTWSADYKRIRIAAIKH